MWSCVSPQRWLWQSTDRQAQGGDSNIKMPGCVCPGFENVLILTPTGVKHTHNEWGGGGYKTGGGGGHVKF